MEVFLYQMDDDHYKVYKLFSTNSFAYPNLDVINLVNENHRLKNASVCPIDSAGNYHCLTYDYIKGTNVPSNLRQFYNILCALDNLHTAGYVHGDVRLENMIFAEGNEGYLIDYDFARKEHYPYNYNTELEVRHKTASPSQPMLKYHDRYSLSLCILKCFKGTTHKLRRQLFFEDTPLIEIGNRFLKY